MRLILSCFFVEEVGSLPRIARCIPCNFLVSFLQWRMFCFSPVKFTIYTDLSLLLTDSLIFLDNCFVLALPPHKIQLILKFLFLFYHLQI